MTFLIIILLIVLETYLDRMTLFVNFKVDEPCELLNYFKGGKSSSVAQNPFSPENESGLFAISTV